MLDRTPRVFISYSWTSMEFQQRVRELAESLRQDGIDVKLDLWDLKDGQDKYAFMEQCVTDPDIDKVLIICDSGYAAKADRRQGASGMKQRSYRRRYMDTQRRKSLCRLLWSGMNTGSRICLRI